MNKILLFSFFVKIFSGRLDLEVEEHFCEIIQGTENFWNIQYIIYWNKIFKPTRAFPTEILANQNQFQLIELPN